MNSKQFKVVRMTWSYLICLLISPIDRLSYLSEHGGFGANIEPEKLSTTLFVKRVNTTLFHGDTYY